MKTFFFFILTFLFFSIARAQNKPQYGFNKGDFFIAGAINYDDSDNQFLFIKPSVGYFLTSRIALGIQSEFLISESNELRSVDRFGFGINGKYFFMPKRRFNIFTELALDYTNVSTNFAPPAFQIDNQLDQYSATLATGFNFFITKKLSLFTKIDVLKFKYQEVKYNFDGETIKQNDNYTNSIKGLKNLNFGIMYTF